MKGPTLPVLTAANVSMPRHTHTHRGWGHWACSGHVPSPPVKCHITVCINTASSQETNMRGGSNREECSRLFVCLSSLLFFLSLLSPVHSSPLVTDMSHFPLLSPYRLLHPPSSSYFLPCFLSLLAHHLSLLPHPLPWVHSVKTKIHQKSGGIATDTTAVCVCVRCGFDGGVDGSCSLKHSLLRLIGKHESSPQHSLFCYTYNMTQACEHEHILRSLPEINGVGGEKKGKESMKMGDLCLPVGEVLMFQRCLAKTPPQNRCATPGTLNNRATLSVRTSTHPHSTSESIDILPSGSHSLPPSPSQHLIPFSVVSSPALYPFLHPSIHLCTEFSAI